METRYSFSPDTTPFIPDVQKQKKETHLYDAVYEIDISKIAVAETQIKKVAKNKVNKHRETLERDGELLPIDVDEIHDGTFRITGNGRHRYFAYKISGYNRVPVNIKGRLGWKPTKKYDSSPNRKEGWKRGRRRRGGWE